MRVEEAYSPQNSSFQFFRENLWKNANEKEFSKIVIGKSLCLFFESKMLELYGLYVTFIDIFH